MVNTPPASETLSEIAARHGRSEKTIRNTWARHPDWPAAVGKRGRAYVYDPAAVDQVVADHFARPAADLEPRRLYTTAEIATATGLKAVTIRAEVSKGRWPAADDTAGRVHRWYGSTVLKALQDRRGYRSTD
ncbi:hypothetical protein HHL19_16420 [Streptomyces sp. R302]|uniref:helix-turn-helix transcriptional regulator n=1 Tax=unclassified Streptomyces TaxID=2593676 RepID=UPI00145F8339|nr:MULTISPECIES: hypothetical protein [unclassified Streptomyces]NML55355.1 hypothetical protein [Streptomyces sp. R301]NML80227.1 hypothetical protein [Streptomyces sp. R302]